ARELSRVSGGPVRAYGPTMRPTAGTGRGAGAADGWNALGASSAGSSFPADLRSAATVGGAAGADRTRCIGRGAAGGTAAGSGAAFAVATSPLFCSTARCLGRTPEPRYR